MILKLYINLILRIYLKKMEELQKLTIQVRRDILRMVHKVNSGHPGGSLGCTEFLVVLYKKLMNRKLTFEMNGFDEDLFRFKNTWNTNKKLQILSIGRDHWVKDYRTALQTMSILKKNKNKLSSLASRLLEKEVIFKEDLVKILGERPFIKEVEVTKEVKENNKD